MDRAMRLVEPYTREPWVLGAYLVGSASRPFRDAVSDFDVELAADDDAYARMTDAERHSYAMDPDEPTRVDHEFLARPWSELEGLVASTRDVDHYPFRRARILYDPRGDLAALLERLGALPAEVREERVRVHYMELYAGVRRSAKCARRGGGLDARLVAGGAVEALAKLLFLLEGEWPSTRHWTAEELGVLGVPEELVSRMAEALEAPEPARLERLLGDAQARLEAHGFDVHRDLPALRNWAFLSETGKRAFAAWGNGRG